MWSGVKARQSKSHESFVVAVRELRVKVRLGRICQLVGSTFYVIKISNLTED
jgi:hypothetical protein